MPDFSALDIPPPKYWQDFETLCCEIWKIRWNDPNAQKYGRQGQKQNGLDVFGRHNGNWVGVQCKLKENLIGHKLSKTEILDEVNNAKKFHSPITDLAIATTAKRDTAAQNVAMDVTNKHQAKNLFPVTVYSWDDILVELNQHQYLIFQYCRWALDIAIGALDYYDNLKRLEPIKAPLHELKSHIETNPLFPARSDEELFQETEDDTSDVLDPDTTQLDSQPVTVASSSSLEEIALSLDKTKKLIDNHFPGEALEILHKLKELYFPISDNHLNFRLLTNIGNALFMLEREKEAGDVLLEAYSYDSKNEKAIKNKALALLLLGKKRQAKTWIDKIFENSPNDVFGLQLLVQSSNKSEGFQEVLAKVPEDLRSDSGIAFSLGVFARRKKDFATAQKHLEQSIRAHEKSAMQPKAELAMLLAEKALEDPKIKHYGLFSDETKRLFNHSLGLFSESWDTIEDTELKKAKIYWLINKANVNRLIDNLEEAKEQVEVALSLVPDSKPAAKLLVLINFELGNYAANVELLKSLQDDPEGPLMLAEALRMTHKESEAIGILEGFIPKTTGEELRNAQRLLNQLYIDLNMLEKSNQLTENRLKENPKSVSGWVDRGRFCIRSGDKAEANNCFIQAEKLLTEKATYKMRVDLAHAFYEIGNYEMAAELYGAVSHVYTDDILTNRYLRSLYNSGFENKALEICQSIRETSGPAEHITEIEAAIYTDIGDLHKAKEIIQEYLVRFPEHFSMQIRLAFINLHTFNFDELDKFLKSSLPEDVRIDIGFHLVYFLKTRGFLFEALDRLYNIRKMHFSDNQAHLKYIGYIFEQDEKINSHLHTDQIALGSAFCLESSPGEKEWLIIEKDSIADLRNSEIGESHSLAKAAIGKKVGDVIHVQNSPPKTITEIKTKYLFAFHESLRLYESYFPDDNSFQRMPIHIPDDPHEKIEGVETIFDKVSKLNEYSQRAEQFYKRGDLTIGAMAKLLNRHPIEIWGGLLADDNLKIRCCIGNNNERMQTLIALARKPKLVVDITSLLTLYQLDAHHKVVEYFGKLNITQSTLDELLGYIEEKKGVGSRGYLSLSKQGENFYRSEITPEQIANQVLYLEKLVQWIRDNCNVIPCYAALSINRQYRLQLYEVTGQSFIDTALIAQDDEYVLLTDDLYLRQLARNEVKAQGAWTQVVLFYLMEIKHISREEYSEHVMKLLDLNYSYIFINDFTLLKKFKESDWKVSEPVKRLSDIVFGPETELASAIRMLIMFYSSLWTEPISADHKEAVMHYTLTRLLKGKSKSSEILDDLLTAVVQYFYPLAFTLNQVLNFIQSWLDANSDVKLISPEELTKEFVYPWPKSVKADKSRKLLPKKHACSISATLNLIESEKVKHFVKVKKPLSSYVGRKKY